jgi:alpha,alpha-trehalase
MDRGCPQRYRPIEEYAFLSDAHTAALVGPDGAVEWLCAPRFDSPSVFARLLDRRRGGAFELRVEGAGRPERRYLDGTLVLESRFQAPSGTLVALDFLLLEADGAHAPGELYPGHLLVRLLRCERGVVGVRARIDARPDYARGEPAWQAREGLLSLDSPGTRIWASSDRPLLLQAEAPEAAFDLGEGEQAVLALRYAGDPTRRADPEVASRMLDATVRSWRGWLARCRYGGVATDAVLRSALVLKGLVFHESGALLAAPTTSLPEEIGGERNWDYRYSWLRDATIMLLALLRLGYGHEARDYMDFLLAECASCGRDAHLVLGIGNEHALEEVTLEHLEGATPAPAPSGSATPPTTSSSSTPTVECSARRWSTSSSPAD